MWEILREQLIYFWYYFDIQIRQIFGYWLLGIVVGSLISVFAKDRIYHLFMKIKDKNIGIIGTFIASILGILSPICMYGTIPIAASFSKKGMEEDWLAAFMMSSILLNPQLLIYSAALGTNALLIRLNVSIIGGFLAGLLVRICFKSKKFFNFSSFEEKKTKDTDPNMFMRLVKNIGRNIKATGLYFLIGIALSALFQRYVPVEAMTTLFGGNEAFGVLMAATIGVPLYACGGGTIPLLQQWLWDGMSMGSAVAFMLTGPSTKITNPGGNKNCAGDSAFFTLHRVYYGVFFDYRIGCECIIVII